MKALVKSQAERGIWMQEVDLSRVSVTMTCSSRSIAVQYAAPTFTSFSGTTGRGIRSRSPTTIGHEFSGEIVECGSEVKGFIVGDRVSAEGHVTCGVCRNCRAGRRHLCMNTVGIGVNRNGAFAEYISVPAFNVFKLPDSISDDMAAILDPLGNATHTALSFRPRRRRCVDYRRRADWRYGRRHRTFCRRTSYCHY